MNHPNWGSSYHSTMFPGIANREFSIAIYIVSPSCRYKGGGEGRVYYVKGASEPIHHLFFNEGPSGFHHFAEEHFVFNLKKKCL